MTLLNSTAGPSGTAEPQALSSTVDTFKAKQSSKERQSEYFEGNRDLGCKTLI